MRFASREPRHELAAAVAALAALAVVAVLALAGAAGAERDGPVLGGDGVWHAGEAWTIDPAESLAYADMAVEAAGNLTLRPGANLSLENVTLSFVGSFDGGPYLRVELGATLDLLNTTVSSSATDFSFTVQSGTLACFGSHVSIGAPLAGASRLRVQGGNLTATGCLFAGEAAMGLFAERATIRTSQSRFLFANGTPAPIQLSGAGQYVLDSTVFGTLHTRGAPRVELYSSVTFRLQDAGGEPVAGRVNGSTEGPRFFYSASDPEGTVGPLRLLWMVLDPAPDEVAVDMMRSAPILVTGVAGGVGGNTTDFVIDAPAVEVTLPLNVPFDVGLQPLAVAGGELASSGPRAFYVDLGTTHGVSVRVRNGEGRPSPPIVVRVRQAEADPDSWALHAASRELPPLQVGALAPGETVTVGFDHDFGEWGTRVAYEGPCYRTTQYFSVLQLDVEVGPGEDFGPWNNTVSVGIVAFRVEGDPEYGCIAGSDAGAWLIAGGASAALVAAALLGYYFSEGRAARLAARRSANAPREGSPGRP